MRTAPVELLTQAEIVVETGAAIAALPAISAVARTLRYFRVDILIS
jgi:hypothetical protein